MTRIAEMNNRNDTTDMINKNTRNNRNDSNTKKKIGINQKE